jgi:nucleoside-diphosphate-sugar epimerase
MRVLIVGGTGNISTAISRELIKRGVDLTHFNRGERKPEWSASVPTIVGDRTQRKAFQDALAHEKTWDCVIDMVCYEPADAACDVEVFRGNTAQLIFCSTVDVYSKTPPAYPVSEANGELCALASFPYGYKKVECEKILWEAHRRGDFALTVMRPAYTYNETWSPGIHSFGAQKYHLDRLRKGKPFILHGDGATISVATHRDDAAAAFVAAICNTRTYGQAYNVTGDEWMTQNHIWRTIARLMGAPEPDFVYIPTDLLGRLAPKEAEWCMENFRHNIIYDNSKAKRDLGFRYTVRYEEGARRSIEWLTSHNAIEDCAGYPFYDRLVETWKNHTAAMAAEFRV